MRLRCAGLLVGLCLPLFAAVASASPQYLFQGAKWPGGVVRYFNGAPDQAWAVRQAVDAWNRSGARVRFVAVPRSQAQLVITDPADKVFCSEGHASIGFVRGAHVVIFPARGLTHACNRYWAARLMTHELGHVLGLQHEDRYCAAMNASGTSRGGGECAPKLLWAWRCRLLEPDDVAGIARIYGGRPRPVSRQPLCPLYEGIRKPTGVAVRLDPASGQVAITFVRPAEPAVPAFAVPVPWHSNDSFVVSAPAKDCPTLDPLSDQVFGLTHWRWHGPSGTRETFTTPAVSGTHCYSVWAIDELGRPGEPATVRVTVP